LKEFLISESALNKNLIKIFPRLPKYNKHLLVIDFICTYINEKIINEYLIDSTNYGMTQIIKSDDIINKISYDINIFRNELRNATNKAFRTNHDVPHIIFNHNEFIKNIKSKISISKMEKILIDLNRTEFSGVFPLYTVPDNLEFKQIPKRFKTKETLISLNKENLLGKFEVIKLNKYNTKYNIFIDNRFVLYLLNNIITNHYFNIPYKMYDCNYISTISQLFMRRFVSPSGFGKRTFKKINFQTIKNELGIKDKSCQYIKSKILEELQRKGYIKYFHNRTMVQIEYTKMGRSIITQNKKSKTKFRRNSTNT